MTDDLDPLRRLRPDRLQLAVLVNRRHGRGYRGGNRAAAEHACCQQRHRCPARLWGDIRRPGEERRVDTRKPNSCQGTRNRDADDVGIERCRTISGVE